MKNVLAVLVGPSGIGKTSVMKRLRKKYGTPILCSYTTRKPRKGEIDGDDYRFISMEEMNSLDLLERVEYAGNCYGTGRQMFVDALAEHPVSVIAMNIDGAKLLRKTFGDAVKVVLFTMPQDKRRALLAKRDGADEAEKRLAGEDTPPTAEDYDFDLVLTNDGSMWNENFRDLEAFLFRQREC